MTHTEGRRRFVYLLNLNLLQSPSQSWSGGAQGCLVNWRLPRRIAPTLANGPSSHWHAEVSQLPIRQGDDQKDSVGTTICTLDVPRSSCSLVNSRLMMSTQSTRSLYKHFSEADFDYFESCHLVLCESQFYVQLPVHWGRGMCGCASVLSQSGDDCHAMTTPKSRQRRLFLLINFRRTSVHVRCATVCV